MRHGIWVFPNVPSTGKLKNTILKSRLRTLAVGLAILLSGQSGCGIYSMTGAATAAKTITVDAFFNNTDLAPANIALDFTNRVKDYLYKITSIESIREDGELHYKDIIPGN